MFTIARVTASVADFLTLVFLLLLLAASLAFLYLLLSLAVLLHRTVRREAKAEREKNEQSTTH
jgi:membrane protein implicated in regulation of membrane protease activity